MVAGAAVVAAAAVVAGAAVVAAAALVAGAPEVAAAPVVSLASSSSSPQPAVTIRAAPAAPIAARRHPRLRTVRPVAAVG